MARGGFPFGGKGGKKEQMPKEMRSEKGGRRK